jgi:predicted RNase H-related nuclease YkuK (DUF458 family)
MKVIKKVISILLVLLYFTNCEKRAIPPDSNRLSFPTDFRATGNFRSIKLHWTPINQKDIAGYKIYVGTASKSYTDTIVVNNDISIKDLKELGDDQQYFFAISTMDVNHKESELSDEIETRTYIAFEDFSQADETLDTTKWHYEVGYTVPVVEQTVSAAEIQLNDVQMRRSFGQYLKYTPINNFAVECDFKLGTPNVGGAGLMIRSELSNPEKYYKGYNAFIFWNFNNWELRLEESLIDKFAMPNATPIKLPEIRSDEWIKLSILYNKGLIEAAVRRLSDNSVLGTISANDDNPEGKRPTESDKYCGFFTTQYGGNIIYADNFGIRRSD